MADCSVLRVGPPPRGSGGPGEDAASALRAAVAARFRPPGGGGDGAGGRPPGGDGDGDPLAVSNRYFDARVLILGLDGAPDSGGGGGGDPPPAEDGAMLVFDAFSPAAFDALSPVHDAAVRAGRCGDVLRLCVGASFGPLPPSGGSKRSEEEYARRVLWCLDRGYEYVEADVSPEGLGRGHGDRDKEGFARVVEAIGGCMWSSRVMRGTARGSRPSADATAKEGGGVTSRAGGDDGPADATPSRIDDAEREKAAVASLMQGVPEIDATVSDEGGSDQQERQQRQDEMAFHQLERTLVEAKRVREASKNNSMSDAERRERAGDVATQLMGLLDELGLGEDASDDDSELSLKSFKDSLR